MKGRLEIIHYLWVFFFRMNDIRYAKKSTYNFRTAFDDRKLPTNNMTAERMLQIDKVAMPLLEEMLDKLRQEQPHLFKSPSSIK